MPRSLLEELPGIVRDGRREAERILESLESRHRVRLQTREWVLPSKDAAATDWIAQAQRRARLSGEGEADWQNRLIYGDNLLAMAALLAGDDDTPSLRGKVDLVYIDPPFDSKADYRIQINLPGVELEQRPTVIEQFAYSDAWADGTASYLRMIVPRLVLMRELLADTGVIFVHLDWHVGHYVKIAMDEVFGKRNFRNEIVWRYRRMPAPSRDFQKMHDAIYRYSKSISPYFFQLFEENAPSTQKAFGGKKIVTTFKETGEKIVQATEEDSAGTRMSDVWEISYVQGSASAERRAGGYYGTQKPEKLLERVIESSCPPRGIVVDFFGGSGTTAAVAERLGRRWITTDLGKPACMIMRKRLIDQDARPFLYQAIGDYQVETAKSHMGRGFRIGDLAEIVLSLYGALPLPAEENPLRNLGQVGFAGKKTLVLADSPNKLTGDATLRRAIAQRDNLMGGWDRVVVLGWNFEPSIGESLAALNDSNLEVLVIPPDLLDRLRKKGGIEKLRGQVRFSSLQYLTLKPSRRQRTPEGEELQVTLDNYVLLSPEAINLDEDNRLRLQKVLAAEPLALIEYWAVDPDYDGQVFRSVWQDYRGNTAGDGDPLRVVKQARFAVPARPGPRKICVRAVDVFGFESEVVQDVAEPAA
ncbi:DNA methyltransferase [Pseudoxanthomonas sp.]|uniref:DNA methyltransferase n=1 Tax=Pseudoxanthomonas sp. TaxID=1871049 RepID=UPI00258FC4F2|nr:DNA methyltransferase [Pseudoxanthomonas sp.]MCR6685604.1 DNA methyltransferase [Pseudoxanthomonas sp.]